MKICGNRKITLFHKVMIILGFVILFGTTVFVALNYSYLPEQIPNHFDVFGNADSFSSKSGILFPVILSWLLYVGLVIVSFIPKIWNVPKGWSAAPLRSMLLFLALFISADLSYTVICQFMGKGLGAWYMPVFLIGCFVTIIVGMICSYRKGNK